MLNEIALTILAGVTVLTSLLTTFINLRQRGADSKEHEKSERIERYRARLRDIQDAIHRMVQLRHVITLGGAFNNLPSLVSIYSMDMARLYSSAIAVGDKDLDEAIAMFREADEKYQAVVSRKGVSSDEATGARGEFQLSYVGVLMRINQLLDK